MIVADITQKTIINMPMIYYVHHGFDFQSNPNNNSPITK